MTATKIDFAAQVQPILQQHCWKCHGADKRSGGLRLDEQVQAEAGGDSGQPILGGTLETNELYRRVASDDRSYRMPKNAEALAPGEIDILRRWVEQGTPWPTTLGSAKDAKPQSFLFDWIDAIGRTADRYKYEYQFALPFVIAFIVANIGLFTLARSKRAYELGRPWAQGRARAFCRLASGISNRELTFVWLLLTGGVAMSLLYGHVKRLAGEVERFHTAQSIIKSPWTTTVYGYPPQPVRPDHPHQVAGTYYRGNCERNPELFNGGNYLTSIFHVSLCDARHQDIVVGDLLPKDGLFVRIEIERAPGTADGLFSKEMMGSVYLSERFYDESHTKLEDEPERLQAESEGQAWVSYARVRLNDDHTQAVGLIYIYTGRIQEGTVRGEPHYAVKYDLRFAEGRLAGESDLWMSSFGNPAVVPPAPADKIPFREWFDFRPIPPIAGENSTDPKLLGFDEYVRKGLIKPPAPNDKHKKPDEGPKPQAESPVAEPTPMPQDQNE